MGNIKHLTKDQVKQLVTVYLQQAEARVVEAWIGYKLNPQDTAAKAVYEFASERLKWLEEQVAEWG